MASDFTPERRRFAFPILPGISEQLDRLRRAGWVIERMRFDRDADALEVIAWRPAPSPEERRTGGGSP
ncbi:MAG: hypothetical protein HY704_08950 [Gemmatimonadetes bacterium]|nr:hypothetical protein [Gemmatimonadota bacterium]